MNDDLPLISLDVRSFNPGNSIDTCAIWNLLSSARLTAAARNRQCWFAVAGYVRFEALDKPRSSLTPGEDAMRGELRNRLSRGQEFREVQLSVADLAAVAHLPASRRLGRGEVAAAALALKIRCALMTDDQKARRQLSSLGITHIQTTPHLLGWLSYHGEITDGDIPTIIAQHEERISHAPSRLTKFFKATWRHACALLLMDSQPWTSEQRPLNEAKAERSSRARAGQGGPPHSDQSASQG